MLEHGACPSCQRVIGPRRQAPVTAKNVNLRQLAAGEGACEDDVKAPWHFKLLMVMMGLYFVWRIIDLFI